jgi:hypothetical protein
MVLVVGNRTALDTLGRCRGYIANNWHSISGFQMTNPPCQRCGKPPFTYVDDTTDIGWLCYGCYLEHEHKRRLNMDKYRKD